MYRCPSTAGEEDGAEGSEAGCTGEAGAGEGLSGGGAAADAEYRDDGSDGGDAGSGGRFTIVDGAGSECECAAGECGGANCTSLLSRAAGEDDVAAPDTRGYAAGDGP